MSTDMSKMTVKELRVLLQFFNKSVSARATKATILAELRAIPCTASEKALEVHVSVGASTASETPALVRKSGRRKSFFARPSMKSTPAPRRSMVVAKPTRSVFIGASHIGVTPTGRCDEATKWIAQQQWTEAQQLLSPSSSSSR
jgi:hypothetical protein